MHQKHQLLVAAFVVIITTDLSLMPTINLPWVIQKVLWTPITKKNLEKISEHSSTAGNQAVLKQLILEQENLIKKITEAQATQNSKDNNRLQVTANMLKIVYAEVRLNIPNMHHSSVVQLLKGLDVNLGYHHYEKTGARKMIKTISDTMNLSLMENLLKQQCPCRLIIDSSTIIGLYHYMTILIQTLERASNCLLLCSYRCQNWFVSRWLNESFIRKVKSKEILLDIWKKKN